MNVHKTSLPDSCTEKEIRHHPALVFGKRAFLDIGLLQKQLQLLLVIGFDMTFINFDCLHLEMWKIALIHEKMDSRYEVPKIRINTDIVIQSRFQMQNVILIGLLINVLNRRLRVEVFKELRVALLIVIDRPLP